MKKLIILLSAVITFTFAGGFYAGITYTEAQSAVVYNKNFHAPRAAEMNLAAKDLPEKQSPSSKVLMGYVQDYHDPSKSDYTKLTHVIFSFAHPAEDGTLLMSGDYAWENLRETVKRAHEHEKKVLLAVGGWFHIKGGESYHYFKKALSNKDSRTKLVNELAGIVANENLDGVDIDFEHPRSQEDAQLLAAFIKELDAKLQPAGKELTIAVYAKVDSVTGQENKSVVFLPSMFADVDYANIMAYDGHWDGGYNAKNLSTYTYSQNIVKYWSGMFEANGIPKDKLVLGVPFYAQPEDQAKPAISYSAVIKNGTGNADRDSVTINGMTYHYNGKETIQRKTELALANEFGGLMLWEAGHDAQGTHSLTGAIYEVMQKIAEKENNLYWVKN